MEVLLFALFFISALIFFIAGKDDFGRTENKLIIKGKERRRRKHRTSCRSQKTSIIKKKLTKVLMIYGFAYLGMVLAISAGWIFLAVLKKPDFIEKPLSELKNKIRPFLNPKEDQ